jgi:hypothetical protein
MSDDKDDYGVEEFVSTTFKENNQNTTTSQVT